MESITFFREWLKLQKSEFRILTMLADRGEFKGTLSDICRYLSITTQTSNTNKLKLSIQLLQEQGYIECETSGRTYTLRLVPKEKKIDIPRRWADPIIHHEYSSESVAWEQVLKVFIWIYDNRLICVQDAIIAKDLNVSVDVITSAKNVLDREFRAIIRDIEKITLNDGSKRNVGQRLAAVAEWSE